VSSFPSESIAARRLDASFAAGAFASRKNVTSRRDAWITRVRRDTHGSSESRIRIPRSRPSSGFTLIELLVVVVIIGVISAALVIAIGGSSERQLANASDRFEALIGHACNQAELTGREIGVVVSANGYAFSRLDRDEWRSLGTDGELRGRSWPTGLRIELTRDDRTLALSVPGHETPQLVCFSSGEMTPFALVLALGDATARYRIVGKDDGSLTSGRVEAQP
jgi:general secretion pathway protein H